MNIPRQFYGVNYASRLIAHFQDTDLSGHSRMKYHEIENITEYSLPCYHTHALGLRAETLSRFLRDLCSCRENALDGLAFSKDGSLVFSGYRTPFTKEIPRITNSACKTVIAIGIMFAVSEGLIREKDTVLSFFPEYETVLTPKYVKQMTVYHLLTMTSGSKCTEMMSALEENWIKAFLLTDCQFEPGTGFFYNSMNTYMLSAILVKVTGKSFMEYLRSRLFEPLGINHIKWELCPKGIERGGWGLHISLEGMVKIGMFLADNGMFCGKQLIEPSYIQKMKTVTIEQDADTFATGYGYQLWHLPKGLYMLSGMYGQHVIIDEKRGVVVATNAHNDRMFPDSKLVRSIAACITDDSLYIPQTFVKEEAAYHRLMKEFKIFQNGWRLPAKTDKTPYFMFFMRKKKRAETERLRLSSLLSCFDGKRLHISQASIKLFPYLLQAMYDYPPFVVTDIAFRCYEDYLKLCFYREYGKKEKKEGKKRERIIMEAGLCSYRYQNFFAGQDKIQAAVKAFPATDEDGHKVVMLDIVFPAQGFSRMIKLFLSENRISVECQEYPDMRAILEQVLYGDAVIAGNTIELTNKIPDSVRVFLEHMVEPRVNGFF